MFDTILDGDNEAKGGAVADGQGLAVHFVGEDGLGVEGAGHVDADIVSVIRCGETDVFAGGFGPEIVMRRKVAEFDAAPPGDLAPPLDAFEFVYDLGLGQPAQLINADAESVAIVPPDI